MKNKPNSIGAASIKGAVDAVGGQPSTVLKLLFFARSQSSPLSFDECRRFEAAMAKFETQKAEIVEILRRSFL